jgi:hypothetical protein
MTDATTIYRALAVDRYTDASWDEYIRAQSRADDGRDPAASGPQSVEDVDRGAGVATDGGVEGAVDNDFEDAEQSYDEQVAEALADVPTEPLEGGVAIDLVTRQAVFVRRAVAETCREYYHEEGFDLVTYKMHPWLPGIGPDNTVYECVYVDGNPQNAHKPGKTYDFPAARLIALPVAMAWNAYEVDSL